jgi:hypothetical protein
MSPGGGGGDLGAMQCAGLDAAPAQGHVRGGSSSTYSEGGDRASSARARCGEFKSGGGGGEEYPHLSTPFGSHELGSSDKPLRAESVPAARSAEFVFTEKSAPPIGAPISPPVTPPLGKHGGRGRLLRRVRPRGRLANSSSSPVTSDGGGSLVTVQNSPTLDTASVFPSSSSEKRSLLVGSVEVLLVPPDPGPRVPPEAPLLFWLRKDLASLGCYLADDFIPAPISDLATHSVRPLRSRDLFLVLSGGMANQGRGRGRGNFRPDGDQAGVWLPQNQLQQQNLNQQLGYGFGFPPNWGFPGQFPGPFPVNQWINPQGSWAGGGPPQQQFPVVQQG